MEVDYSNWYAGNVDPEDLRKLKFTIILGIKNYLIDNISRDHFGKEERNLNLFWMTLLHISQYIHKKDRKLK